MLTPAINPARRTTTGRVMKRYSARGFCGPAGTWLNADGDTADEARIGLYQGCYGPSYGTIHIYDHGPLYAGDAE